MINGDYECRNRGIASYTGETSMLTSIVCNDRIDNGLIITSGIIIPSLNFPIHLSKRQSKWDKVTFSAMNIKNKSKTFTFQRTDENRSKLKGIAEESVYRQDTFRYLGSDFVQSVTGVSSSGVRYIKKTDPLVILLSHNKCEVTNFMSSCCKVYPAHPVTWPLSLVTRPQPRFPEW